MDAKDPFARRVASRDDAPASLTLALVLVALTMVTSTGYGLWQALEDRTALRQSLVALETPHQQAARLRGQVEGIARQVARLAEQGNPNAREIVEALRRQGISINPN